MSSTVQQAAWESRLYQYRLLL